MPNGYDAIKLDNVVDVGGYALKEARDPATVWAFKNPESQIKSADPITYDDNGKAIPLSERFNQKNNDVRYSSQETDFTKDFDYSGGNWATDLGIITSKDRAVFERTINNEIYRGAKPQSANGEYIIDTGKCLMFTDGDFHNPTLSCVIVFATEYESLTDDAKRRIIDEAETTGEVQLSLSAIESIFGEGFVSSYTRPDGQTYAGQNRGRKRSNGSGTAYKVKSLKERLAEEGKEHLLYSSQESDADNVPTFYSRMGKVVEGVAQNDTEKQKMQGMFSAKGWRVLTDRRG